jgi:hypothetical protein
MNRVYGSADFSGWPFRVGFPISSRSFIAIITDIDTPRGGLIAVDERPLMKINETLGRPSTQTTR